MSGTAYSIDGRTFAFEIELVDAMPIGAYVRVVTQGGLVYLGQVLEEAIESSIDGAGQGSGRLLLGKGTLLARIDDGGSTPLDNSAVFGAASLEPADDVMVAAHLAASLGSTAGIGLGELQGLSGVTATLHASGFGRHTFLCGQSGSGKTYTLGIVLERLLLDTDIRIVVIDPNSDFVNLASVKPQEQTGLPDDQYQVLAERYRAVAQGIEVFGGEGSQRRLRAKYGRLSLQQQTMVLGLDPLADPEEYNAFVRAVRSIEGDDYSLDDLMDVIRSSFDDDLRRLGLRIENLGIAKQSIWAGSDETVMDSLGDDWRMFVADIGSLPSSTEGSIAAAALLGRLWENRRERQPVIIVIDEAHNICPQVPQDANQALATEHVVRIAGEGRKYGMYLLLSTQRPSKVHQNVLSQCDNLLLMRMNSAADLRALAETFSYAPAALVKQASGFGLGEGLAAGRIAPDPLLFRSGLRLTEEGGSDVPSTWARG